jgi:hypothetical protein
VPQQAPRHRNLLVEVLSYDLASSADDDILVGRVIGPEIDGQREVRIALGPDRRTKKQWARPTIRQYAEGARIVGNKLQGKVGDIVACDKCMPDPEIQGFRSHWIKGFSQAKGARKDGNEQALVAPVRVQEGRPEGSAKARRHTVDILQPGAQVAIDVQPGESKRETIGKAIVAALLKDYYEQGFCPGNPIVYLAGSLTHGASDRAQPEGEQTFWRVYSLFENSDADEPPSKGAAEARADDILKDLAQAQLVPTIVWGGVRLYAGSTASSDRRAIDPGHFGLEPPFNGPASSPKWFARKSGFVPTNILISRMVDDEVANAWHVRQLEPACFPRPVAPAHFILTGGELTGGEG